MPIAAPSLAPDLATEPTLPVADESRHSQAADTQMARPHVASKPVGEALLERIQKGLVGNGTGITTPFGQKPLIYADYTASGRAVSFIEENIRHRVLPYYANTHTEASYTGAQSNRLREQARQQIRASVHGSAQDKVIFTGAGATAAINKLIDLLGLRRPLTTNDGTPLADLPKDEDRPVVFVGPYEHHSNELPWRESIAEVVSIPLTAVGHIDADALETELQRYAHRPLRIGSFSAASNVTGLRSDVVGLTRILKSNDALACWDYAAAGPYVTIDVNRKDAAIDAVFVSPHKFIGGPGTPGVLVVKESIVTNTVPAMVGGGTVKFVSPTDHSYVDDIERREEGGTPAIVESIRAGAVFALKSALGDEFIEEREAEQVAEAFGYFQKRPQLRVLGPCEEPRLPIFSLRFEHAGKDLHYGFVAALLNDLFGIQARGGCSCAGPYGHHLLDINAVTSRRYEALVEDGFFGYRPGWVRLNFHYAAKKEEINYLLDAIGLLSEHGHRLLPSYRFDLRSGNWVHRDGQTEPETQLADLLGVTTPEPSPHGVPLQEVYETARDLLLRGASREHKQAAVRELMDNREPAPDLRWFWLPGELERRTEEENT